MTIDRIIPKLPDADEQLNIIIDTDFANEVDDLYAVALALAYPNRFNILGFIATHFNNSCPGPLSIEKSYNLLIDFLKATGFEDKFKICKSAHPISYYGYPSEGEGVDFIIEQAHLATEENPLWVVALGAATNLASAILKDPTIIPKVRFVFHGRSEDNWPERSKQFNVLGDVSAARTLLEKNVPLVWFDTGKQIKCSMEFDEKFISTTGAIGSFLYNYRKNHPWKECQTANKGFFDLGDIAYLLAPEICKYEIINAPSMDPYMFFDHNNTNGNIIRVYDIDNDKTWNLLIDGLNSKMR